MTRRERVLVMGLVILAGLGVAYAQQPATVTQTFPARFQPVALTESVGDNTYTVMLDTKANAGNTCFLLIQSKGLSGLATVVLPATACQ